jgi:hypothetical protein
LREDMSCGLALESQKSLSARVKNRNKKVNKHQKTILAISAAGLLVLTLASSAEAALLPNGDFAAPIQTVGSQFIPVGTVIPGWTVVGSGGVNVDQTPTAPPNPEYWPGNPTQFLDLTGNTGGGGILSDAFATTPGQTYEVTFENYNGSLVYPGTGWLGSDFSLVASGGALYTWTGLTPGVTRNLTYTFTADATTSTLTFMDTSGFDSNAGWIDNVGVSAVPETTTMIMGAMLFLPFGMGTLRMLRKSHMA